jgi:nucleotide-binding universal stress UspA family protein
MTEAETKESDARRILVALDTSARGQAALQAAVRLALKTRAELQGLYVEDEDLVRLAALPFSREVDLASALSRELHSGTMKRALRAAAQETQQTFSKTLQPLDLQWTFRVVRGTVTHTSLAAAGDVDLLVIGQRGRLPRASMGGPSGPRKGSTARVVAIFDGSPSAARVLELATSLIEPESPGMTVLIPAGQGEEVTKSCMSWLQQHQIEAEIHQLLEPSEEAILHYVRQRPPGVLLINRDSNVISRAQINQLVDRFEWPIVLC